MAARTWNKHPDELDGNPYADYMLIDLMALHLILIEEESARWKATDGRS